MKKTVIYAKHILYRQYEPTIKEQIKECEKFAKKNNYNVVAKFFDEKADKTIYCNAYDEMIDYCRQNKCNYIIMQFPMCLSRIRERTREIINNLSKEGIKVIFTDLEQCPIFNLLKVVSK